MIRRKNIAQWQTTGHNEETENMEDHECFSFLFFQEGGVRMKQASPISPHSTVLTPVFSEWRSQLPGREGGTFTVLKLRGRLLTTTSPFHRIPPSSQGLLQETTTKGAMAIALLTVLFALVLSFALVFFIAHWFFNSATFFTFSSMASRSIIAEGQRCVVSASCSAFQIQRFKFVFAFKLVVLHFHVAMTHSM
jgi:hypothetical protein